MTRAMVRAIAVAVCAGALLPLRALAQTSQLEIGSPLPGETVAGQVQIVGTALDPGFSRYELDWAPDPPVDDAWQPIQPPISQQVRDGVLGVWDTTAVPDGLYLIRLRIVRLDESSGEVIVRVLVVNATPTPPPTLPPTATNTPPPGTPSPGPSPTPLIQQPPTRTPRPSETPGGPTETPPPVDAENSPFRPERLRQAACSGVYLAFGTFLTLGLYSLIRAAARGQLRSHWWYFRREVLNPLFARRRRGR